MKVIAFLQNQWFYEPDKIKAIYARHPDMRNDLIKRFLFYKCKTGKVLKSTFGEMCDRIIWEEVSPEIGGTSSSVFPADVEHMMGAIQRFDPEIILCFGNVAAEGMRRCSKVYEGAARISVLYGPHPTSRRSPEAQLADMAAALRELMKVAA